MGSCSSSSSGGRGEVVNVTVLTPSLHAAGAPASHAVSKGVEQQQLSSSKKKKDEKDKKKDRKKEDKEENEKDGKTNKDKHDKKKKRMDKEKHKDEDKKDDNAGNKKKEKKKKNKHRDRGEEAKEDSRSSDSSSSTDEEDDQGKAIGNGNAATTLPDAHLSDSGHCGGDVVVPAVALRIDADDTEKRPTATVVDGAYTVEAAYTAPAPCEAPSTIGQIVVQTEAGTSLSIEARVDLSDQSQTTKHDASDSVRITDDAGGSSNGGTMSVDIVVNTGVDGVVAINGDFSGGASQD